VHNTAGLSDLTRVAICNVVRNGITVLCTYSVQYALYVHCTVRTVIPLQHYSRQLTLSVVGLLKVTHLFERAV